MPMTTAELVGQSLMFRLQGPTLTDDAREAFREIRPGGVLFFADNIESRGQVHALVTDLQAEARNLGLPPLLIAADQEGGIVSRLPADFVTVPGPMALAASGDPHDIETAARITGEQLREVGITVNFAPSVDVNNNPANPVIRTRSFGDTPERVIASLAAVMRGHEAVPVVTTVKHFPGHGDTSVDSHLGLPTIPWERERIDRIELAPFRAAVEIGVPAVMSAHILFPALDPDLPATLSEPILTGLLRGELGFTGVVFTDAMDMRAISEGYGLAESTILAKEAGVDVLEANEPVTDQLVRHATLLDALESVRLPAGPFEATVDRLDALRARYGIDGALPDLPEQPAARWETALAVARRTIAHVGPAPFRPVPAGEGTLVVDMQRTRTTEAENPIGQRPVLRDAVGRLLPNARVITVSENPDREEVAGAVTAAASAQTFVILTRDASDLPRQREVAGALIEAPGAKTRVIHCAMRGPYDAGTLSRADDTLLTFGDPPVSIEALVEVLAGRTEPTARTPVALPGLTTV